MSGFFFLFFADHVERMAEGEAPRRYLVEPMIVFNHTHRREILRCYFENYHRIRSASRRFANGNATYNFELRGDQPVSAADLTRNVFGSQRHAFRVNASVGFILFNNRTRRARYWYPCWNNSGVYDNTPYIHTRADWNAIADRLSAADFLLEVTAPRESTEETVVWTTQLFIWTFCLHHQVLL